MIISQNSINLPWKSVLRDLASRSGSPDEDSPCPYPGEAEWFFNYTRKVSGDMLSKLDNFPDFNSIEKHVQPGQYVKDLPKTGSALKYFEGLKDEFGMIISDPIDVSWVKSYLGNIMYNINVYDRGGFKEEKRRYGMARAVMDSEGEDGEDLIESSDLITQGRSGEFRDTLEYMNKLPYLIKRLHECGREHNIHMMSLVIAYEKAKKRLASRPQPASVLANKVYKLNFDGSIVTKNGNLDFITENKGDFAKWAYPWISGKKRELRGRYYKNLQELLGICSALNIDLTNEDPLLYTQEFIDSLTITYIENNKEFLLSNSYGQSIIDALKSVSREDIMEIATDVDETKDYNSIIKNKIFQFTSCKGANVSNTKNRLVSREKLSMFLNAYQQLFSNKQASEYGFNPDSIVVYNEFIQDEFGGYLILPAEYLIRKEMVSNNIEFIVHESGTLVMLDAGKEVFYLPIEYAMNYISNYINKLMIVSGSTDLSLANEFKMDTLYALQDFKMGNNYTYGYWFNANE